MRLRGRGLSWVGVLAAVLLPRPSLALVAVGPDPRLESPADRTYDEYGRSLAVWENVALVGSPGDDTNRGDSIVDDTGAVHVYARNGQGDWQAVDELKPTTRRRQRFGFDIAFREGVAVVGAPPSPSTIGSVSADSRFGQAWIYEIDNDGAIDRSTYLTPTGLSIWSAFGRSVAASRDTVAVSAPGQQLGGMALAGSVYVFQRVESHFQQIPVGVLQAETPVANDQFGSGVAIVDDQVIVGSLSELTVFSDSEGDWEIDQTIAFDNPLRRFTDLASHGDTLVVGDTFYVHEGVRTGAAHVYQRDATGVWSETYTLLPDSSDGGFGQSLAVWEDTIVVGDHANDEQENNAGAVFLFRRDAQGAWLQEEKYVVDGAADFTNFGYDVALWEDHLLAGANKTPDPQRWATGSVYPFRVPEPSAWGLSAAAAVLASARRSKRA